MAVAEYEVQAPGEMLLYPGLRVDVLEKSDSGECIVDFFFQKSDSGNE